VPTPAELYDYPVQITTLQPPANRLNIMQPLSEDELSRSLLGGEVVLNGVTAVFCSEGYYVPANEPDTEACQRVNFNQPGFPQQLVVDWDSPSAEWRTSIPESSGDLTQFGAIQLRTALDPLSDLNSEGEPQSFTIEVVDASNRRSQVVVPDIESPLGIRQPNENFEGDSFTGHVYLRTVRIPLEEFESVNMNHVTEIALLFDQSDTGTLFIADLELVKGDS
jgi:hypothetical protein